MVTITSVGYGDITPVTVIGRVLAVITAILGLIGTSIPTVFINRRVLEFRENKEIKKMIAASQTSVDEELFINDDF